MTHADAAWPAPPVHRGLVTVEPLRAHLLELDTAAYVESPVAIAAHSAGRWPTEGFTAERNVELIGLHEREHDAGEAFAYAVLDDARTRELGCAYLRRLDDYLARSGTVLPGAPDGAAVLTFWAIDDAWARPAVRSLAAELLEWCRAWSAAPVVARVLPEESESVAALLDLGLDELTAGEQPLPYRWFLLGPIDT